MLVASISIGIVLLLILVGYCIERRAYKRKRDPVARELGAFVRRNFGPWD